MASEIHDLVTSYVSAVGEHRLDALPAMLEPDVESRWATTLFAVSKRSSADTPAGAVQNAGSSRTPPCASLVPGSFPT